MLLYWVLESACLHLAARRAWPAQRLGDSVVTSMIGQLFNCITPFASGGQPIQAFYMTRGGMPVGKASSVLLAKFIVYQTVLALYSAGVLVFAYRSFVGQVEGFTQLALIGFAVNAAVVVVLFCVGFFPKITGRLLPQLPGDPGPAAHRPGAGARRRRHRPGDHRLPPGLYRAAPGTPGDGGHDGDDNAAAHRLFPGALLCAEGAGGPGSAGDHGGGLRRLYPDDLLLCAAAGASGGAEGSFYMFFRMFFKASGSVSVAILLWRLFTFYLPIVVGVYFARHLSSMKEQSRMEDGPPRNSAG